MGASSMAVGVTAAGTKDGPRGDFQRDFVLTPPAVSTKWHRPGGEIGHPPAVWVAAWCPNGTRVLTGSRDGTARIWHLIARDPMQWSLASTFRGHTGVVWSVAWSPDGNRVITGGSDGLARIWRSDDPEQSDDLWTGNPNGKRTKSHEHQLSDPPLRERTDWASETGNLSGSSETNLIGNL